MDEYISRQVEIEALENEAHLEWEYLRIAMPLLKTLEIIPTADVVPYSIESDGTLTVTVPKGTKKIGRILIEEDGTQYGGLFYPDTGGCFLSSMERSEQDDR